MQSLEQDTFAVSAAAFTDPGQTRKHNEDFVAYHIPSQPALQDSHGALFVVCDGVAGGALGEVASEHAVRRILNDYYQIVADQDPQARLLAAVEEANADLYGQNASQPDTRPMTTTVVAAVFIGNRWLLAHAGDSRAYLVRGGQISQVTQDHSWVAEMVRSGDLTPAEAAAHPWRNRITRALGTKENVDLDAQAFDAKPGDRLVLCSDGLTRHVSDSEILESVTRRPPRLAAQQLISLANQRGGMDNISVLVVELAAPGETGGRDLIAPSMETAKPPAVVKRPRALWPLAVIVVLLLAILGALFAFAGGSFLRRQGKTPAPAAGESLPAAVPLATSTPLPVATVTPTPTSTLTPLAPTATLRPTSTSSVTPVLTLTSTITITPVPSVQVQETLATTPRGLATGTPTRSMISTLAVPTLRVP